MEKLSEEEIHEGNLLIATFMKAQSIHTYENLNSQLLDFRAASVWPDNMRYHSSKILKYHSSYQWIMPVIETLVPLTTYKSYKIMQHSLYVPGVFVGKGKELWVQDDNSVLLFWRFAIQFIRYLNEKN